ncbi:photosynthetic complex assembly protein PuhC [Polaromonas sp. YR568]|jgi:putative photosynthetic complex assembly protein|uniref:photosynthetic complex assembly protein PuhC n=1 Tax=Polaromonas sp. YR568 TaxID=1855301 RepID=UPI003137EC29
MDETTSFKAEAPLATSRPWPAWLLGLAVVGTLAGVTWQRSTGESISEPRAAVQWQRSLNFEDRPNGDVVVVDPMSRQEIARFEGEQGFVRGTLRALARERKRASFGPEIPFELVGYADGRLSLRDQATGADISLESFGPVNAGIFARLQTASPTAHVSFKGEKS